MYSTYFQEWLSETFKPCILVYCSDLAKASVEKNNLSPADFLRPLGDFTGNKIETAFIEKDKIPFLNLQIDFYDNNKFKSIQKSETQNYIKMMFSENAIKWDLPSILINRTKENILKMFSRLKYYSSHWIRNYELTLFECLSFSEYELYQQPLLNIFLCSSLDDPSVIINILNKKENIPELITKQIYESPQENLIIILNDLSNSNFNKLSIEQKEENINKFKNIFTDYSIIHWDINEKKNSDDKKEIISDLYKRYFHKLDIYNINNDFYRKKENIYGIYITEENILKYKKNFYEYFSFFLKNKLPLYVKENIDIIQNSYGIKTFLAGFSFLSNKEEITFYPDSKIYKFKEIERAYYNLGLIYFYFHAYTKAFECFKSLKGILKEKSIKHKERINELLTICKFIISYNENEFNFVEEMISEGSLEQIIRNELIIIKMFENNESLYPMIENILHFIIATKQKFIKAYEQEDNNKSMCFNYLYPLLYENIGIYYISNNYFRKFQIFMIYAGEAYNSLSNEMKIYSLNSFSYLLNILNEIDSSFLNLKLFYNDKLSDICKKINYWDSHFKFAKNCFELLINKNEKINIETEEKYLNTYLNSLDNLNKNDLIKGNDPSVNCLDIPQVDNSSLFVLEQNDYMIKLLSEKLKDLYKKEQVENPLTWLVFNKYSEKLVENYYVYLIEDDLSCIKMLYDLSNRKLGEMVNRKNRKLKGNINQKLYVNISIKNPLTIKLDISSIKLNCDFYPSKNYSNTNLDKSFLILNEENIILKSLESKDILLTVASKIPGKMIINGIDFIFFQKCKINHLFSKKIKKRLYVYRRKYARKYSDDDIYKNLKPITETKENKIYIERVRKPSSMYKKRKIEYEIKDLNEDLYVSFPKGDIIDVHLYQLVLFPICITNNSNNVKIKRTSIFLENSDNRKIKTFFKYITKKTYINPKNNREIFVIPFIPLKEGDVFIKIIIKFEDEIRIKPVEIRRAIIKINIKQSISFELKEVFNNYKVKFDISNELKIISGEKLSNLKIIEPIFNRNKFKIINNEEIFKTEDKIHIMYSFKKLDFPSTVMNNNLQRYNFDFINQELEKENINININNHIIEKFNKILNSDNNIIFFPWTVNEIYNSNTNKKIYGLFPYKIRLEPPNPTKSLIKELLYDSTKLEITKNSMNGKTLVIISIFIDKSLFFSFNNTIYKYEIFINEDNPELIWIGGKKYVIINNANEGEKNIFECKFCFMTSLKGLIKINKISSILFKNEGNSEEFQENLFIKKIIKPFSIFIE